MVTMITQRGHSLTPSARVSVTMYLFDDSRSLVNAEFSLDHVDGEHCIVVESSGGSNPARSIMRRNPGYNKLLSCLFSRLGVARIRVTRVMLDSAQVATIPVTDRVAELVTPYPVDLSGQDVEGFRKMLGRAIAAMHRDPAAMGGGNAQKRIRICLERPVRPEQLRCAANEQTPPDADFDHAPGLGETEKEYLRSSRIGQGGFRNALLERFGGMCPLTGIVHPDLLIASHIKPWSACTNSERLDSQNGLLLSALVDRLFDRGLITFSEEGCLMASPRLSAADRCRCNLSSPAPIALAERSKLYMAYHRRIEFVSA
ncbi:MAG: hypothetical protein FJ246_11995 [Nitrospira sp.]|nr:hypothetical protein [Nitrospira sp.]